MTHNFPLLLAALLAAGLFVAQPQVTLAAAGQAAASQSVKSASVELKSLALSDADLESAFAEIQHYQDAGFIYQPELSFSSQVEPDGTEDMDWKSVVSGFADADRAFAFFFGTTDDVLREQQTLEKIVPAEKSVVLARSRISAMQKELSTPAGRKELVRITQATMTGLADKITSSEESLRFFGGHMYGTYVERLYITAIMVLAAAEEGTLEPLYNVRVGTVARMYEALTWLGTHKYLGDSAKSAARLKVVERLGKLAGAGRERPSLDSMRKIVSICQDVRDSFMK